MQNKIQNSHMKHDTMYRYSAEYKLIQKVYGDTIAERSKVPLIHHITEGIHVLQLRKQELWTQRAFCLHPIFQIDENFAGVGIDYIQHTGADYSVTCALEYRGIANAYLSKHTMPPDGIQLSPLPDVNEMLIADKVQNRKDFEKYHLGTHSNSDRLVIYFHEWLEILQVDETTYQEYVKELDNIVLKIEPDINNALANPE